MSERKERPLAQPSTFLLSWDPSWASLPGLILPTGLGGGAVSPKTQEHPFRIDLFDDSLICGCSLLSLLQGGIETGNLVLVGNQFPCFGFSDESLQLYPQWFPRCCG